MTAAQATTSTIGEFRHQTSDLRHQTSYIRPQALLKSEVGSLKSGGVTLIELVVVMGVIAIIAGLSVPALTSYAKQVRLKTTTRQVVGVLSLARSLSISAHEPYTVAIDPSAKTIRVVESSSGEALEQVVRIPKGVTVSLEIGGEPSPATEIVFQPTGALTGRTTTVVLAEGNREHRLTITGSTGAITVD